ncbi:hypothetical protein ACGIF2_07295 [Cellulomonas sp. P22]|uniref:hypothetical protein n=1 Tax=Cellulomonas sp. P22 TaxID=3373189 RepID=UPI003790041F
MPTRLLLEGVDLAELMVHVRAEFGPTARIVSAERVRSGGFAGFFAKQRYELTVDVPDDAPQRPRAMRQPPAAVGLEALLVAAEAVEAGEAGAGPAFAGQDLVPATGSEVGTVPGAAPGPQVSTGAETFASVLDQVRAMAGGQPPADLELAAPAAPSARRFEPLVPSAVPAPGGASRESLRDLGVPDHFLARVPGTGPVLLSTVLEALPVVPPVPRRPGSVVVVAGPAAEVVHVAARLAERLGQTETDVVLAGRAEASGHGRRLATSVAASRWRPRASEEDHVVVVALGVGADTEARTEAAAMLHALAPDQAWGVVDAHSKLRDAAHWLAQVGRSRAFDVLAVHGLFETTQPGTVLDLGVPVAWIDGLPATRVAWAAALSDRLDAATRWD